MKFWVKIVVALCVVVVIVFGVWAFFFREKDVVKAYNQTTQLVDYKESLGLKERLVELSKMDYLHNEKTRKIVGNNAVNNEILNIRKDCLSSELIVGYDEHDVVIYSYDSYFIVDKTVDDIIRFYLPYTRGTYSSNTHQKNLSNTIKVYIESLSSLDKTIDNLIACQKEITGEDTAEMDALRGHYNQLYLKYRNVLNKSSQVMIALTDYINVSLYGGKMMADSRIALYDCYARALKVATSKDEIRKEVETLYLHDLHMIWDKMDKVRNGIDIYDSTYTEYKFLTGFNALFCEYRKSYDLIFDKVNLDKRQMADGEKLSDIVEKAKEPVIVLLNVLGF